MEPSLVMQGRNFTTNDCHIDESERILLITGYVHVLSTRTSVDKSTDQTWPEKVPICVRTL